MKRTLRILSSLTLALLAGSAAHAKDLPSYDASFQQNGSVPTPVARPAASRLSALVASRDPRTGAPSFVWGASSPLHGAKALSAPAGLSASTSPEDAARAHLAAHADLYGLSQAALDAARVVHVHDLGRGGIIVVLRQEIDGVPLLAHEAKVLLRRDRSLVALSGGLHLLHTRGVVHANVSPSHVLLRTDGSAVLVGYGRAFLRRDGVFPGVTIASTRAMPRLARACASTACAASCA